MASKKTTHRESKTQVENSAQKLKKEGRTHQKGEIISRDELEKKRRTHRRSNSFAGGIPTQV